MLPRSDAGLVVSFVAYVIKDADTPARRIFGVVGLAVLVTAVLAFLGLREVAAFLEGASGGGHSHGAAEEPAADDHAPAVTAPAGPGAPAPGAAPTAKPAPAAPSHADGHAH
ncbi:hypothetical protein ACFVX6_37915 [Streptomyces sp. NPDC058289]|uniref:hypothetical protein n=1 Tax=Streptomyces sp. NPDC058289 TaxID=3346425 RepID=UPI0036F16E65